MNKINIKTKTNAETINWPDLLIRTGHDESMIKKIVEAWSADNGIRIEKLSEAINNDNLSEVCSLAHAIKGSAATISADALAQAAKQLEVIAKNGNLDNDNTREIMAKIQTESEKIKSLTAQPDWIQKVKKQA